MSLIITLIVSEGIVLASDSRITETLKTEEKTVSYPLSDNANKTFLAKNGIGFSYCGQASLDGTPFSGFANRFIDNYDYSKNDVFSFTDSLCKAVSTTKLNEIVTLHVAGFDDVIGTPSPVIYSCRINVDGTYIIDDPETEPVAVWSGQPEVLMRLLKKQLLFENSFEVENITITKPDGSSETLKGAYIIDKSKSTFFDNVALSFKNYTLQDAIDFARFAIQTTIDSQRFISMEKTVGGPIDVLVIKPGNNTIWINKKELK